MSNFNEKNSEQQPQVASAESPPTLSSQIENFSVTMAPELQAIYGDLPPVQDAMLLEAGTQVLEQALTLQKGKSAAQGIYRFRVLLDEGYLECQALVSEVVARAAGTPYESNVRNFSMRSGSLLDAAMWELQQRVYTHVINTTGRSVRPKKPPVSKWNMVINILNYNNKNKTNVESSPEPNYDLPQVSGINGPDFSSYGE